jgi:hypothetical protein
MGVFHFFNLSQTTRLYTRGPLGTVGLLKLKSHWVWVSKALIPNRGKGCHDQSRPKRESETDGSQLGYPSFRIVLSLCWVYREHYIIEVEYALIVYATYILTYFVCMQLLCLVNGRTCLQSFRQRHRRNANANANANQILLLYARTG